MREPNPTYFTEPASLGFSFVRHRTSYCSIPDIAGLANKDNSLVFSALGHWHSS